MVIGDQLIPGLQPESLFYLGDVIFDRSLGNVKSGSYLLIAEAVGRSR